MIHIALHFLIPLCVALLFVRIQDARVRSIDSPLGYIWAKRVAMPFIVMIATMLVDVDHFLADPIYDPQRCSIGFHPLHQPLLFPIYLGLSFFKKTRWIGVGLIIHMLLDSIDCQVTNGLWMTE